MNLMECFLAGIALAILSVFVFINADIWGDIRESEAAAAQMRTLEAAMQRYYANYPAAVSASLPAGVKSASITLADLKAASCLRRGFPQQNVWGQPYKLWFYRNDSGSIGFIVMAAGTSSTGEIRNRKKLIDASARLDGGVFRPDAKTAEVMNAEDGSFVSRTNRRWNPSSAGIDPDRLPAGSFGLVSGAGSSAQAVQNGSFLARRAEGGAGAPEPETSAMDADLDMGDNPMLGAASVELRPLGEGLLYFNGSAVSNLDEMRAACKNETFIGPGGETLESEGAEGFVIVDSTTGMWRCANRRLAEVSDGGSAVQIKAVAYVPYGKTMPVPEECPAGTVPAVYAIPAATEPQEDSSGGQVPEGPIRFFGTSVQEYVGESGDASWRFLNSIDVFCPGGACPPARRHANLVVAACMRNS